MEKFLVKYQIPLISFHSQDYEVAEFTDYHSASHFAQEKTNIKNRLSGKVVFGKLNEKEVFSEFYYGCRQLTHIETE